MSVRVDLVHIADIHLGRNVVPFPGESAFHRALLKEHFRLSVESPQLQRLHQSHFSVFSSANPDKDFYNKSFCYLCVERSPIGIQMPDVKIV